MKVTIYASREDESPIPKSRADQRTALYQSVAPGSMPWQPEAFSLFILWSEGPLRLLWASKCPSLRKIFPPKHEPLGLPWESSFSGWQVQPCCFSTTWSQLPVEFGKKTKTHLQKNLWIWPQWGFPFSKLSNQKVQEVSRGHFSSPCHTPRHASHHKNKSPAAAALLGSTDRDQLKPTDHLSTPAARGIVLTLHKA